MIATVLAATSGLRKLGLTRTRPPFSREQGTSAKRQDHPIRDNGRRNSARSAGTMVQSVSRPKPPGAGTRVWVLALSYDIVVKPTLRIDRGATQPGEFTAFRVTTPRIGGHRHGRARTRACLFWLLTTEPDVEALFASDSDATSATARFRWEFFCVFCFYFIFLFFFFFFYGNRRQRASIDQ